jgi:hypothetical protein
LNDEEGSEEKREGNRLTLGSSGVHKLCHEMSLEPQGELASSVK